MNNADYPHLYLRTLFENTQFLARRGRGSDLITNQVIVHSDTILVNMIISSIGEVYALWWPLETLKRERYEQTVKAGVVNLNMEIKNVVFTKDYVFILTEDLSFFVLKIEDFIKGEPNVIELRRFYQTPRFIEAFGLQNMLILGEENELKVMKLIDEEESGVIRNFQTSILGKDNKRSLYFPSKRDNVLHSLIYLEKNSQLEVHFKLFSQANEIKEMYFYYLIDYYLGDLVNAERKVICSVACEQPIVAAEMDSTGERLLILQVNGFLFVIQNVFLKGSKVFYGKQKQIDDSFQLKWVNNLPIFCCFGKGILFFFDFELNFLRSFKDKNASISLISFINCVNNSLYEELPILSYIKEGSGITIKYLTARSEDVELMEQINVSEELLSFFFEAGMLQSAIAFMKEKVKLNSRKIKTLEMLFVTLFEQYYPKHKSGAEAVVGYYTNRFRSAKDNTKVITLINRIVMVLIAEEDIEPAYRLAKEMNNLIGLTKVKNYCKDKGFTHLLDKVEGHIDRVLKIKYELDNQTVKDLRYLKDIGSVEELLPFDDKLNSVLEALDFTENDLSNEIDRLVNK